MRGLGEHARGALALLLVLDQFPRSLWRDTPAAYAQDIKANLLVLKAVDMASMLNGALGADVLCRRPWPLRRARSPVSN